MLPFHLKKTLPSVPNQFTIKTNKTDLKNIPIQLQNIPTLFLMDHFKTKQTVYIWDDDLEQSLQMYLFVCMKKYGQNSVLMNLNKFIKAYMQMIFLYYLNLNIISLSFMITKQMSSQIEILF